MLKINGKTFEYKKFPDGTPMLRLSCTSVIADIEWIYESNEELTLLWFIVKHMRSKGVKSITLHVPYLPNARMDRIKEADEVFTLKYFCELINAMKFDTVYVRDVHSDVSLALLDNVRSDDIAPRLHRLEEKLLSGDDIVFFPDEGASKRYKGMINRRYAFGIKRRDWRTGKIQGLDIAGDIPEKSFNALIIDDISSYGGTFLHSAKKLKECGAEKIWLYVTHCEESILNGELIKSGLLEKIYTTDSIFRASHELIEILD